MMNTSRPGLVIFDMDDVLCHYDLGRRLRLLANMANTTARDVRAALWDSGFETAADSGAYPDGEQYLSEFSQRLGSPISRMDWLQARRAAMTANMTVIGMAKAISAEARITILTNNGPLVKSNFEDLLPEAAPVFKERYCSYEFRTKKPDPACYLRLLEVLGHEPEDTWFIDDKRSNVEGARIAGLHSHHFKHEDRLEEAARGFGFLQ